MLSRDVQTLTSSAFNPYLDFLAEAVLTVLTAFEARKVPTEVTLDDNSNETIPKTPGGEGFDSSLTLPEIYKTPPGPSNVEAKSGVSPEPVGGVIGCSI